jgi:hypothetical protein
LSGPIPKIAGYFGVWIFFKKSLIFRLTDATRVLKLVKFRNPPGLYNGPKFSLTCCGIVHIFFKILKLVLVQLPRFVVRIQEKNNASEIIRSQNHFHPSGVKMIFRFKPDSNLIEDSMLAEQWCTPTNISGIFQRAFLFFRHLLPVVMKVTLIILVPVQLIALAAGFLIKSSGTSALVGWTMILITTFGGQLWLTAALISFSLQFCIAENITPPSPTLKNAIRSITPLLSLYLIIFLFIFGISLLFSMLLIFFAGKPSVEIIQSIQIFALFTAFFILYPRFLMAPFALIDESLRVGDALRKSTQLFNVNRRKVLSVFLGFMLLNMLAFLLNFVSPVLSFICVLFFVPYSIFIQTFLYLDLKIECGEFVLDAAKIPKTE